MEQITALLIGGFDQVDIRYWPNPCEACSSEWHEYHKEGKYYTVVVWRAGSTDCKQGIGKTLIEAIEMAEKDKVTARWKPDPPKGYQGDGTGKRHKILW